MQTFKFTTFLIVLLVVLVDSSMAQWGRAADELIRLPLGPGPQICSDGNGGCWVAANPVGLCHVDRNGNLTWGNYALIIPPATSYDPKPVLADNGEAILAMEIVYEDDDRQTVYLQRFNLDREFVWGEEGIQLDTSSRSQSIFGAYAGPVDDTYLIHWARFDDGGNKYPRLQLINGDGDFLWGIDGIGLNWPLTNSHFTLTSDQCVIAAQNVRPHPAIEIIKIDSEGERQWSSILTTLAEDVLQRTLGDAESDRAGGAILVYEYERYLTINDTLREYRGVNAMRISGNGDSLWTRQLYERDYVYGDRFTINPLINYAGSGRFFIAWADYPHTFQVVALDIDGELLWGEPVDVALNSISYGRLEAVDSDSGVCYAWVDTDHDRESVQQQFGQRISLDGERLWGDRGRAIQARTVWNSSISTDSNGGVITVVDFPTSVQMINRNGEIGVVLPVGIDDEIDKHKPSRLSPQLFIYPNPANSLTTLKFTTPTIRDMTLKFYDLQGRLLFDDFIQPGALTHPLDISVFPSGSYILQLQSGAIGSSRTLSIIK